MSSPQARRLEGKTILITGASSGIGRSTAMAFAQASPQKLSLILTARRFDRLRKVAKEIESQFSPGLQVLTVQLDSSKPEDVKSFVQNLPEGWRKIDVLVNNA